MGQQQLLLIVLGILIIGIAIIVGINLFQAQAVTNKRDIVVNECQHLATLAIEYSKKPSVLGGGGHSFTGWAIPSSLQNTVNGTYTANANANQVVITGTGSEVVSGNDSIKVQTTVIGDSIITKVIN